MQAALREGRRQPAGVALGSAAGVTPGVTPGRPTGVVGATAVGSGALGVDFDVGVADGVGVGVGAAEVGAADVAGADSTGLGTVVAAGPPTVGVTSSALGVEVGL